MSLLTRITLVVILVYAMFVGAPDACCSVETRIPFEFKSGVVNILEHSENPETPLWYIHKNKFPSINFNYTVQNDGWLEISSVLFNGSRPKLVLNGEIVYGSKNPFYYDQVYSGDLFELELLPPEYLNKTVSINVEDALTIYELYTWETIIGEIVFTECPRGIIDASFSWTPEPVEGNSLVFSPSGLHEEDSTHWLLIGPCGVVESDYTHLITESLDVGEYSISLYVEDAFGYNKTETMVFTIAPNDLSILLDPSLTSVSVSDIGYSSPVEANEIIDVTVLVDFVAPVSRDIRVFLVNQAGETLTSVEDQVVGNGSEIYLLSFESAEYDMMLEACVEFLHEENWIQGVSNNFVVSVAAPVMASNGIPGFPVGALLLGLGYYLKRRVKK